MNRLSELIGWKNRCDTFDTYYRKIDEYEIIVSKHINSKTWDCTLVKWDEEICNEININSNTTYEWVIKLEELLMGGVSS